ncbi:pseudouridine synthase [Sphingomonas sp. TDK1]|uniref:pseudouridine synthase n=1 Tax=Sphingomonas sp. TDK1 TaxID=453247 RepID=UPI0007D8FA86|nr:pseudouridine synthase [Sphingomonas sp. TDK1]OAN59843.1 pseudouridine synthase [Sphingomonas sp. TDK1]
MSDSKPIKTAGTPQRIAKLLARAGIASRREIERMIAEGRIALNGTTLDTPATILTSLHGVTVDGNPVAAATPARLFRYHKAAGLLTAERDFTGRPTIYDRMPEGLPRVMPVGRLDLNTEGLLLLTTDGELKREMELPASGVERTYRARAYGQVSQEQLEDLMLGIEIEGVRYGPINANIERRTGANLWIEMTLTEGKNREVRNVLEFLGLQVSRLIRTRYGPFYLNDLPAGDVDEIRQADLITFRTVLGKAGGGKAASNLQFATRQRAIEPVEKPAKVEPEGRRRIAKPAPVAKGPVFTARATPKAKPKDGEERPRTGGRLGVREGTEGGIGKPARAARAKSFRDTREPRAGDLVDRPRGRRDARGDQGAERVRTPRDGERTWSRSGESADRGRTAGPSRFAGTDGDRPRGPRTARAGGDSTERNRAPRPSRFGGEDSERSRGPRGARPASGTSERSGAPRPSRFGGDEGERPRGPRTPRPAGNGGGNRPQRPGGPGRPPRGRG